MTRSNKFSQLRKILDRGSVEKAHIHAASGLRFTLKTLSPCQVAVLEGIGDYDSDEGKFLTTPEKEQKKIYYSFLFAVKQLGADEEVVKNFLLKSNFGRSNLDMYEEIVKMNTPIQVIIDDLILFFAFNPYIIDLITNRLKYGNATELSKEITGIVDNESLALDTCAIVFQILDRYTKVSDTWKTDLETVFLVNSKSIFKSRKFDSDYWYNLPDPPEIKTSVQEN